MYIVATMTNDETLSGSRTPITIEKAEAREVRMRQKALHALGEDLANVPNPQG